MIYAYWHCAYIGINVYLGINAHTYGHKCLYRLSCNINIYAYVGKMPIGINDMPINKCPYRLKCLYGHLLYRHIINVYRHFAYIGIIVYVGMNAYISIYAFKGINTPI